MAKIQVFMNVRTRQVICDLAEVTSENKLNRTPQMILKDCLNEARRGRRGNQARVKYTELLDYVEQHGTSDIAVGFLDLL